MPVPAVIYPVANSYLNIGREAVAFGTAAASYVTMPVGGFEPDDKLTPLVDEGLRGSMVKTYDLQFGPAWADLTIPESPVFLDAIGHVFFNILGDYTTTGTAASPNSTLNGGVAVGAGSITVASGTGFAANQWIQVDVGTLAEVVQVQSVSTNVLTLVATTPLRFAHLTGVAVTNTAAPWSHTFSVLNPGSTTGVIDGQPPSHTLLHRTFIPGSGNHNAVQYAYACFSELKLSGKATGWLAWEGKANSYIHAYPTVTPTASLSAVRAVPAYKSAVTVAGVARNEIAEWSIDLKRVVEPEPTADGQQAPYVFARGPFTADFTLDYNPVIDETALTNLLNNTQPTLSWSISNGLSGANLVSLTVNAQLGGWKQAPLKAQKSLFGYQVSGELIGNTTNIGNAGGYGPLQVILQSAIPSY